MFDIIINFLAVVVVKVIAFSGYAGIFILMALESCGVPIPSEIIMPFSGFLVVSGKLNFWLVCLVGAIGNLAGSLVAYYIGYFGGRPLIEKYGRYILISKKDLDRADIWFLKYGKLTTFFGRLLPIVRTYISFPAGIAKMNLKQFIFYTFSGAFLWSVLFAWLGVKMGKNWDLIREKLHSLDLVIGSLIILSIVFYIWRHKKNYAIIKS